MRILAIDPGYERMGVAVVEKLPHGKETLLYSACPTTPQKSEFSLRLLMLGTEVERLIAEWKPDGMALEKLFFANNQKTATSVAEVRGMLSYIGARNALPLHEYTPLQVKVAVAGYGKADKKQVETMVKALVRLGEGKRLDDEYDAIAVGLTCLASVHTRT